MNPGATFEARERKLMSTIPVRQRNTQIHKYANTQIHKCINAQIHKVIQKFETNTATSEAREDINEQLPGPTEEEIAMCYTSQV